MGCILVNNPSQNKEKTTSQVFKLPTNFSVKRYSETSKKDSQIPINFNFVIQKRKGLFHINEATVSQEFSRNSSGNLIQFSDTIESNSSKNKNLIDIR